MKAIFSCLRLLSTIISPPLCLKIAYNGLQGLNTTRVFLDREYSNSYCNASHAIVRLAFAPHFTKEFRRGIEVLFYFIFLLFLLKIAGNICMACFFLYLRLTDKESRSVSFVMFGLEFVLMPLLVFSSYISDLSYLWTKPLTILTLSLAAAIGSNLLIVAVVYLGRRKK